MINCIFNRSESGRIISFELTGHADAGPYGSDIVCAAVSALSISTVNGVDALAGFQPLVEVDEEEGGYLRFELISDITQEQLNISQILLENLLLALKMMQEEHSEFIQIQTKHIQGGAL